MSLRSRKWRLAGRLLVALALPLGASPAAAQQPLDAFLGAARADGLDVRVAEAARREAESRVDEARAGLLPSLSLTAGYTRNQQPVVVEIPTGPGGESQTATITAEDQLDARVTLIVPLLDVSAWSSLSAAEASAEASAARLAATRRETEVVVATAWFRLVRARALADAARQALEVARESERVVEVRAEAGLDAALDTHRARADLALSEQRVAEAELEAALAARQLEALTGLAPTSARVSLDDDLREEAPLDRWLADDDPATRAARLEREAAERARDAAWQRLLPVITASASERYSNAAAFGPEWLWAVGVELRWTFDFGRPAALHTSERVVERTLVEEERADRARVTAIHDAWHRVRASVARVRAARAAAEAAEQAVAAAQADYRSGTGTQLALSQAQRDRFQAEVDRIAAEADLRLARQVLRIRSGREEGAAR